jgi:3-methyladenine DNA glycosylase Mpg
MPQMAPCAAGKEQCPFALLLRGVLPHANDDPGTANTKLETDPRRLQHGDSELTFAFGLCPSILTFDSPLPEKLCTGTGAGPAQAVYSIGRQCCISTAHHDE